MKPLVHHALFSLFDTTSVPILPSASHLQGSEEMKLKPQHISILVVSLGDFVRMADRKIIANTLSQLKLELDFDSAAISQLQVVLFGFQDAVSVKNKMPRYMIA